MTGQDSWKVARKSSWTLKIRRRKGFTGSKAPEKVIVYTQKLRGLTRLRVTQATHVIHNIKLFITKVGYE